MKCLILWSILGLTTAFSPTFNSKSSKTKVSSHNDHQQRITTSLSSTASTTRELTTSYEKVFVAGGSRGVGRAIIDKLLASSPTLTVVALLRSDESIADLATVDRVTTIQGDAFDYKTVEGAIDGCDAAITTLGSTPPDEGQRVDYTGNNNVIEACGILGCVRVILVTSIGCGSSKSATPPAVYEALEPVLKAKDRAENVLMKYYTNMNWTIVRPGGLKTEPKTGEAILTEDDKAIGSIHREDVAGLVVQALKAANTERKVFSAIDPSISSTVAAEGASFEPFELN